MRKQVAIILIIAAFVLGGIGGFVVGTVTTLQRISTTSTDDVFDQINSGLNP